MGKNSNTEHNGASPYSNPLHYQSVVLCLTDVFFWFVNFQDILLNPDIQLDWVFRNTFITDIISVSKQSLYYYLDCQVVYKLYSLHEYTSYAVKPELSRCQPDLHPSVGEHLVHYVKGILSVFVATTLILTILSWPLPGVIITIHIYLIYNESHSVLSQTSSHSSPLSTTGVKEHQSSVTCFDLIRSHQACILVGFIGEGWL